jgi:hypothetical protein
MLTVHHPRIAAGVALVWFLAIRVVSLTPLTGDEPHYLVLAQSLLTDQDLKVGNNYNRGDYLPYYSGELEPHIVGGDDSRIRRYSIHAPGLAAIIAPAFAVAGSWGVITLLAVIAAGATWLVWIAGYALTRSLPAAWFGWSVVTLTAPVALLASMIYPDVVAAGVIVAAVTVISGRAPQTVGGWFALGLLIGLLPWLHSRFAIPAAAITIVLTLRIWSGVQWRNAVALLTPIVMITASWLTHFRLIYGSFDPRSAYGGRAPMDASNVVNGVTGLLADQEFGLLPNAPVYVVVAAGLLGLLWTRRRLLGELAVVVIPYVLSVSGFGMWWAGYCPPARLLVPVLFACGPVAAVAWSESPRTGRSAALLLLSLSVAISVVMAFPGRGSLAYNDADGSARWMEWVSKDGRLSSALPSFFRGHPAGTPSSEVRRTFLVPALIWNVPFTLAVLILLRSRRPST